MRTIIYFLSVCALVILCVGKMNGEPYYGLPFLKNYTSDDYSAGIQNYAITQDNRGMLYVGNNMGLLEFDGSTWKRYTVANNTKVRSVTVDADGRIYVGAQNEFGYFFPSPSGDLTYKSLSAVLPADKRNFGEVWKVFNTPDGIYFLTFSSIYRYANGELSVLVHDTPLEESFLVNQKIWFQEWESGLNELDKDQMRLVSDNEFFKTHIIADIIPFGEKRSMICTADFGIYLFDEFKLELWDTPYQENFKSSKIISAIRMKNGWFAIGTENDGLYILDSNGQFVDHLTKGNGLNNRSVLTLYEDAASNLWAGLYNGITYVKYNTPFTSIDERVALPGTGYAAAYFNDQLLLGTNNGLFTYDGLLGPYTPERDYVHEVVGTKGQVYSLEVIDGKLFMGHHNGAYIIEPDLTPRRISDERVSGWWKFQQLKNHPDVLIAGTYDGLYLIKKVEGVWTFITKIEGLNESSRVMEEDANGNIWMSHGYKGVYRISLNDDLDKITSLEFYNADDGFPSNILINVFKVNNRLVFGSEHGVYSFHDETNRFELDSEFTELLGDQIQVREMVEDSNGNIYFMGNLFSGVLRRTTTGTYELDKVLLSSVDQAFNDDLENFAILDLENVLIGGKEGFIHYNPTKVTRPKDDLTLLLRSVKVNSAADSTLFSGNFVLDGAVSVSQPMTYQPTLDYADNSLLFTYTTTEFDSEKDTEYRYLMDGFEQDWSEWTTQNERGYTNLYEGNYTLRVQARNQRGITSDELSYTFTIAPPYYRSTIAYGIYAIGFILIMTGLFLSVRKKYARDKHKAVLEQQQKMELKENEFNRQVRQSEEEINAIRTAQLQTEIEHKNKELASSTMNLISKNEFISKIKNQLNSIASNSSAATSKELQKIAKEIDRNIASDHDWDQFEIHFDQVHGDFSRRLKAAYPQLTNQDMKLCAFLKLNMSSKEIANLLNITVRGVELSRYRLRKKLDLDRSQNLTDFILGF